MSDLLEAASKGNVDEVQKLLKGGWFTKGVNPNVMDSEWQTPLHKAASNGHAEVVRLLVKAGAQVNAQTHTSGGSSIMSELEDDDFLRQSGISASSAKGAMAMAQSFYRSGETPLHLAARWGKLDCARVLLENGANPNLADSQKETPLSWATRQNNTAMVQLLVQHGARQNG